MELLLPFVPRAIILSLFSHWLKLRIFVCSSLCPSLATSLGPPECRCASRVYCLTFVEPGSSCGVPHSTWVKLSLCALSPSVSSRLQALVQTTGEPILPAWVFPLAMFGTPMAIGIIAILLRRRAAMQTARPVHIRLERAALAAMACNVTSAAAPQAGSPQSKGGLGPRQARLLRSRSAGLRSWGTLGLTTAGLLRSPLRERIHLERLVFLSMEHCAAEPELVADVILQVRCPAPRC